MPFSYPRLSFKINMQGIGPLMQRRIGTSFEPFDLYEIYNTARDPDGQPYFKAVNNGTGVKYSHDASASASLRSGLGSLTRKTKQTFFGGGRKSGPVGSGSTISNRVMSSGIISSRITGPNPPVHMVERVIPLIRQAWSAEVKKQFEGKGISFKVFYDKTYKFVKNGRRYSVTAPKLESKVSGVLSGPSPHWWTQAMEDVMDYAVFRLQGFTPVLKKEYDASAQGYTTKPGTLRDSYVWEQHSTLTGVPGIALGLGTSSKRLTVSGSSKHSLFGRHEIQKSRGQLSRQGEKKRGKFAKLLSMLRNAKTQITRNY